MEKLKAFFASALEYTKQAKFELIMLFGFLILDLLSKGLVNATMELGESKTLIPKLLHITYVHNDAAAFGSSFGLEKLFGKDGTMIFFIILSFVAVCFFAYFLYRSRTEKKLCRSAYALIIAGATGNLIDRILYGYVRDFVQFEYLGLEIFGSTTFAIFNIADACLCVGVALFAVYYIFMYKEPKKEIVKSEPTNNTDNESPQIGENGNGI